MNRKQFAQAVPIGGGEFLRYAAPSRRNFFRTAAGASAMLCVSKFARPLAAQSILPRALPKPIPGGVTPLGPGSTLFHFNFPSPTVELSTITDFDGKIAAANLGGTGTGTNTKTGEPTKLVYDVDVRFMQGEYIGTDGNDHFGTFAFI